MVNKKDNYFRALGVVVGFSFVCSLPLYASISGDASDGSDSDVEGRKRAGVSEEGAPSKRASKKRTGKQRKASRRRGSAFHVNLSGPQGGISFDDEGVGEGIGAVGALRDLDLEAPPSEVPHKIPKIPYSADGDLPKRLQNDKRFQMLQRWRSGYWRAAQIFDGCKYVTGVGALVLTNISKWSPSGDDAQGANQTKTTDTTTASDASSSLHTASIAALWGVSVFEGLSKYCTSKATLLKQEADGLVAQANVEAGNTKMHRAVTGG